MADGHVESYEEIDLWELFMVLIKRFKLIAALFLVAVITAVIFNFFILPPVYGSLSSPPSGRVDECRWVFQLAQGVCFSRTKDAWGLKET